MTIRHDATRLRIPLSEQRPLRQVLARQGQALLDTDVNETGRILLDRIETADAQMMGAAGRLLCPAGSDAFRIAAAGTDFAIAPGTAYLDGWRLDNPLAATLASQPHPWTGAAPASPAAFAIKALVRHIDPAAETALADVALGEAQASGRAMVDWQILPLNLPQPAPGDCAALLSLPAWTALAAPSTGTLAFVVAAPAASDDPCALTAAGGHARYDNLLYRLEVHGGAPLAGASDADGPRFGVDGLRLKLSRRNASLMARVTKLDGAEITVTPPALDPLNWFAPGLYAELVHASDDVDPRAAMAHERLFRIAAASDETVTLDAPAAEVADTKAAADGRWFLRLWEAWPDGSGTMTVAAGGGDLDLGDGIAARVGGGAAATFRRGDYWAAPVRIDGTLEWPGAATATPQAQTPHGPEIRYAPVALLSDAGPRDCRIPFATLADRALLYRGGDGQGCFAAPSSSPTFVALAQKLRVAVMRGAAPVEGATVLWRMAQGASPSRVNGTVVDGAASVATVTGPDGLAQVEWAIDAARQNETHGVEAALSDGGVDAATPPVRFNARFDSAGLTSFTPGACPALAEATNVQEALDALCKAMARGDAPAIRLRGVTLVNSANKVKLIQDNLVLNGLEIASDAFIEGISFDFDAPEFGMKLQDTDPLAEIALDLPYPTTDEEKLYWMEAMGGGDKLVRPFAFRTTRLEGATEKVWRNGFYWRPSDAARLFLRRAPWHRFGGRTRGNVVEGGWTDRGPDRVLCRIRLRAALIFAKDPQTGRRIWLNAEHLGVSEGVTDRELSMSDLDPQRAGDFEIFVWIKPAPA